MIRARSHRALVAAASLLGLSSAPFPARAADADKGAAQVLFESGRALVQDRRFAEACPKFAESLRLDPGIGTMLWLADCYENNTQTASAWAVFKEAAAAATLRQDPRAAIAQRRADDLEPKLAKLVLVPPSDATASLIEVQRDGVVIGTAQLGIPVPVDPGVHVIAARATGRKPWTTSVTVLDKPATLSVVIPALDPAPEEASADPATRPETSAPTDGPRGGSVWGTRQTIAVATTGVGLVAIGLGSYFGLEAKSTYDHWYNGCGNSCPQQHSAAFLQADGADALFAVGAAALVGGVLLYFTAPRTARARVAVIPVAAPWGAGMVVSRVW